MLREVALLALRLGFTAFGGPAMLKVLVKRAWVWLFVYLKSGIMPGLST